ncbi:sodium-coupled monocarboxylate transporter 1, partial [Brachionus plicatilis]
MNQSISLSIPWTCFHSLLLPNFIRYRNIPGKQRSRFLLISNFPFMVFINFILLISGGIFCFVYFYACDPIASQKLVHKNQLGTYWIYNVLSEHVPSFAGLTFASIIAYSVVQHSMGLSLCGHTIVCEIIKPMILDFFHSFKDNDSIVHWTKITCIVTLGILSTGVSIGFRYLQNSMLSLFFIFNNTIHSPILALFFLSAFNPYANDVGAMLALVCNLAINFWLALGGVFFSRLKSQEFAPDISQCNSTYHSTMSPLNLQFT